MTVSKQHSLKVPIAPRILAKLLDLLIMGLLALILPNIIGPLLGFFYSIAGDALNSGDFQGQSIGKKVFKLRVVRMSDHEPPHLQDAVIRNIPIGVATFFSIIPFWGWIILIVIGIPLMVMEFYLMMRIPTGHRLGDVMADTEVIRAED